MGADPHELVELLEIFLLGSTPDLTGNQIAERTGIGIEVARERWRSLGFSAVADDEVAFTEADLKAMQLTQRLHDLGLVDESDESALIRALGRSFARLAEWQLDLLSRSIELETSDVEEISAVMMAATPVIEEVMNYVWRRHMVAVGTRMLLAPPRQDPPAEESRDSAEDPGHDSDPEEQPEGTSTWTMAVGFADIVGYTKQSRTLTQKEIGALIDDFEATALRIISAHEGRIIKTIGDEILFVCDSATGAAQIGLELTECHLVEEDFPELRVGLAFGPVLARLGDVFGPTVNVASRLTSTARPGRVLCDRELAEEIGEDDSFRLRKLRRTSVKGYRRLEPWSVRRPAAEDPALEPDNQPGPASTFIAEQAKSLLRAVHESDPARERPVRGEGKE